MRTPPLPAAHAVSARALLTEAARYVLSVRALQRARSHIVVAQGGKLKNISIGVKPAESVTDALAAAAGGEAVPQAEATEADEEKREAAAEDEAAAAGKKDEPEVTPRTWTVRGLQ